MTQLEIEDVLKEKKIMCAKELSKILKKTESTIRKQLKKLIRRQRIMRESDLKDRRKQRYKIT